MVVASVWSIMITDAVLAIFLAGAAVAAAKWQNQVPGDVKPFAWAFLVIPSVLFIQLARRVDASIRANEERTSTRVVEKDPDRDQIEPELAQRLLLNRSTTARPDSRRPIGTDR